MMLERFVESAYFQNFILAVILLNAVVLGLETAPSVMAVYGDVLHSLDMSMLGIFVVELLLKFIVYRHRFFIDPWRVFDFIVVSIALIPSGGNVSVIRALRVLRVFRLITAFPSLRKVIGALMHSLPGIGSIASILMVIFYVFAVMATNLYGADFPEWFGTIGRSMYSLFQIMTLESWSMGIVRPVMQMHPYAWLFFIVYILVSTFLMLNLFIAVVVDAMQTAHLDHGERSDIDKIYDELKTIRTEQSNLSKLFTQSK